MPHVLPNYAELTALMPAITAGMDEAAVTPLLDQLTTSYGESQRHYHTAQHIVESLVLLYTFRHLVKDVQAVGWAILYHDAVYDPRAQEPGINEKLSAKMAGDALTGLLPPERVAKIGGYILATAAHQAEQAEGERDSDLDAFLDFDLGILAAQEERYDEYSGQIKREYSYAPDDAYRAGRAQVLEGLLDRAEGNIFTTPELSAAFRSQAQDNIQRELAALASGQI